MEVGWGQRLFAPAPPLPITSFVGAYSLFRRSVTALSAGRRQNKWAICTFSRRALDEVAPNTPARTRSSRLRDVDCLWWGWGRRRRRRHRHRLRDAARRIDRRTGLRLRRRQRHGPEG